MHFHCIPAWLRFVEPSRWLGQLLQPPHLCTERQHEYKKLNSQRLVSENTFERSPTYTEFCVYKKDTKFVSKSISMWSGKKRLHECKRTQKVRVFVVVVLERK
jgi:hypothetical protein